MTDVLADDKFRIEPEAYWRQVDQVINLVGGIRRTTYEHVLPTGILVMVRVANPEDDEIGTTTLTFVPFSSPHGTPYR